MDVNLEEGEEIAVIVEVAAVAVEEVIIDLTISKCHSHSHRGFLHSTHRATGITDSSLNTETEGKETHLQHGTVVFKTKCL